MLREENIQTGDKYNTVVKEDQALKFSRKPEDKSDRTCEKCGKTGHTIDNCWQDRTCETCGKKGHIQDICYQKKAKGASNYAAGGETFF